MQLKLVVHLDRTAKVLERLGRVNVPFGVSRALTETAIAVTKEDWRALGHIFKIRSDWIKKGYRVQSASMKNLKAVAGNKDEFLKAQEEGGTKTPQPGHATVAVPHAGSETDLMPRGSGGEKPTYRYLSQWPGAIIKAILKNERADPFVRRKKNIAAQRSLIYLRNARIPSVAIRRPGGPRTGKGQFILLWLLPREVKIRPRYNFGPRAEETVRLVWPVLSKLYIGEAIRTART